MFVFHPVKVLSVPRGDGVWSGPCSTSACMRLCPLSLGPDLSYSGSLLCTAGSLVLHTCSDTPISVVLSAHIPTSKRVKTSGCRWHGSALRTQCFLEVEESRKDSGGKEKDQRREREKRNPTARSNTLKSIIRTWHYTLCIISISIPQAAAKSHSDPTQSYLAWLCYFVTRHAYFMKLFRHP